MRHILAIDLLIGVLVLLVTILLVTGVSGFFLRAPFVPTSRHVVAKVLDFAGIRDGDTVCDLGAGDARFLIMAKKRFPGVRAIGCELAPTIWAWGKLMVFFSGVKVDLRLQNLLSMDVSGADCVFLYLMPGIMTPIEKKFDRELKPGATVISYTFRFPTREPVDALEVPWLQGRRKLWKYRW